MRKIIFSNRKGGCGKTTITVNLGVALGSLGKKILIIDLDTQAHSTFYLGLNPYKKEDNLYEFLLKEETDINSYIFKTDFKNISIIPSSSFLSELNIDEIKYAEIKIKDAIDAIKGFDFILFDTSPSIDKLTIGGLISADEIMIPIEMHYLSLQGLAQLIREIYKINMNYKKNLIISGIIPTLFNQRTRIYKAIYDEIKKIFPAEIIYPGIRYDIKLAEAPSHQKPIFEYAPKSRAAFDFTIMAKRVLHSKNNSNSLSIKEIGGK